MQMLAKKKLSRSTSKPGGPVQISEPAPKKTPEEPAWPVYKPRAPVLIETLGDRTPGDPVEPSRDLT